jgi:hypothetical protein
MTPKIKENTIWSQNFARRTSHRTSKTQSSPSSSSSPTKYRDRIQKQRIFQQHLITAVIVTTLGFEHRRSAHPGGVRAKNLFQTGRQEMGKSKQYLQTKIPEQ